jgi:hypothetical protein
MTGATKTAMGGALPRQAAHLGSPMHTAPEEERPLSQPSVEDSDVPLWSSDHYPNTDNESISACSSSVRDKIHLFEQQGSTTSNSNSKMQTWSSSFGTASIGSSHGLVGHRRSLFEGRGDEGDDNKVDASATSILPPHQPSMRRLTRRSSMGPGCALPSQSLLTTSDDSAAQKEAKHGEEEDSLESDSRLLFDSVRRQWQQGMRPLFPDKPEIQVGSLADNIWKEEPAPQEMRSKFSRRASTGGAFPEAAASSKARRPKRKKTPVRIPVGYVIQCIDRPPSPLADPEWEQIEQTVKPVVGAPSSSVRRPLARRASMGAATTTTTVMLPKRFLERRGSQKAHYTSSTCGTSPEGRQSRASVEIPTIFQPGLLKEMDPPLRTPLHRKRSHSSDSLTPVQLSSQEQRLPPRRASMGTPTTLIGPSMPADRKVPVDRWETTPSTATREDPSPSLNLTNFTGFNSSDSKDSLPVRPTRRQERRGSTGRVRFEEKPDVWEFSDTHALRLALLCQGFEEATKNDTAPMPPKRPTRRRAPSRRYSTGSVSSRSNESDEFFWQSYEKGSTSSSQESKVSAEYERKRTVHFDQNVTVWVFPKGGFKSDLKLPQSFVRMGQPLDFDPQAPLRSRDSLLDDDKAHWHDSTNSFESFGTNETPPEGFSSESHRMNDHAEAATSEPESPQTDFWSPKPIPEAQVDSDDISLESLEILTKMFVPSSSESDKAPQVPSRHASGICEYTPPPTKSVRFQTLPQVRYYEKDEPEVEPEPLQKDTVSTPATDHAAPRRYLGNDAQEVELPQIGLNFATPTAGRGGLCPPRAPQRRSSNGNLDMSDFRDSAQSIESASETTISHSALDDGSTRSGDSMDEQLLVEPFEARTLTGLEKFQNSHMSANLAIFEDGSVSSDVKDKFKSPLSGMRSEDEKLIADIMETTRQDLNASGSLKSDGLEASFRQDDILDDIPAPSANPRTFTIAVPKTTLLDRFHSSDLTIFEDGSAMFDSAMLDGLLDTAFEATKQESQSSPTSVWDRSPATPESLPREKVHLEPARQIRYFEGDVSDDDESEVLTTHHTPKIPRYPQPVQLNTVPNHGSSPLRSNLRNKVDCNVWKIKSLPKASPAMKLSPVPVVVPLTHFLESRSTPTAWQPRKREGSLASSLSSPENVEMEVWSVKSGGGSHSTRTADLDDDVSVSVLIRQGQNADEIRQAILAKFQAAQEMAEPLPKAADSTTRRRSRVRRERR